MTLCEPLHPKKSQKGLKSIRLINRVLYLNGDPSLTYLLPAFQWNIPELIDLIRRACNEYDLVVTYQAAKFLAENLALKVLNEPRAEDNWDGDNLPFLQFYEGGKESGSGPNQNRRFE